MNQFDLEKLLESGFTPKSDDDWSYLRMVAQNLFKPKTPVDDEKLFAGRIEQIRDIIDAVYEEGGHAIIFGERGVGKTSLAKIVEKKVAPVLKQLNVVQVSCGTQDDFYTIWGNAFNEFKAGEERPADYFKKKSNPYEIYNSLQDLDKNKFHIFIFDEFDRITDQATLNLMGDLIKHFSNNPQNVTIIIVGVGSTLLDLFGGHESIERCSAQIKMPRMSPRESKEILEERIPRIGMTMDSDVETAIIKLSQGMPGYVHLLGQLTLKSAIERKSTTINKDDFKAAIAQALDKADYQTRQDYYKAIASAHKDNKYKEVLLACAMAKSNELGHFFAGDICEPYSRIRGKQMVIPNFAPNLSNLCKKERGPALVKTGSKKRFQYRFRNPLLQPLAIMIGVHDNLVTLDQ